MGTRVLRAGAWAMMMAIGLAGGGAHARATAPTSPTEASVEAWAAERGNLLRWRDSERARLGPLPPDMRYEWPAPSRKQLQENAAERERRSLRPVSGYFAYFFERDGARQVALGTGLWEDSEIPGATPRLVFDPLSIQVLCGQRVIPLSDVTYLGNKLTPEMEGIAALTSAPNAPEVLRLEQVKFTQVPTAEQAKAVYPGRALERGRGGSVGLLCTIGEASLDCAVDGVSPPGWGFDEAALQLVRHYTPEAALASGEPSAGRRVCLTMGFIAT